MICQVGETLCSIHMSVHCLLEVFSLGEGLFCLCMALTVFCSFNPMASRLSEMAMCVQHTSSILDVVAVRSRASSFLMSSLSLRALTNLYWTFVPFHLLSGSCINQQELRDGQQVHLVTLQVRCEHLPVGRFCSVAILHGPL